MKSIGRFFVFALVSVSIHTGFSQGSLTPPGAPGPTMKSLDQIEPRTPISATHTPGDSFSQFNITLPGSYYLTTNLVGVAGKDCLRIWATNVVLDLNGFSLLGNSNATYGIFVFGTAANVTVQNGTIHGWTANPGWGLASFGQGVTFKGLTVSSNDQGFWCAGPSIVRDCLVKGNTRLGIEMSANDSSVINNRCVGNNPTASASYAAIRINGANNHVEGNHVTCAGLGAPGIHVLNAGGYTNNVIVRNIVMAGGFNNYNINNLVNEVGPIGSASTNNSPWLNISR